MNPIIKYFNGEKAESYIFILVGVIAVAMALYFVFGLKTSFWKGVAIPFVLVAILEVIVGFTIVTRSENDMIRAEKLVQDEPQKIKTEEIPRMEVVLRNFVIYRYVEIALIILGIVLMYSTPIDTFWQGIGLGFFIKAGVVLGLDFFAERRGQFYLDYLTNFIDKI
jgi:hypothetical protein